MFSTPEQNKCSFLFHILLKRVCSHNCLCFCILSQWSASFHVICIGTTFINVNRKVHHLVHMLLVSILQPSGKGLKLADLSCSFVSKLVTLFLKCMSETISQQVIYICLHLWKYMTVHFIYIFYSKLYVHVHFLF